MARGHAKEVKSETVDAIINVAIEHNEWSGTRVRNHLLAKFDKYGLKQEDIPAPRSVQKYLAEYREKLKKEQINPLHWPWEMSSLRKYEISTDVALVVLEIQKRQIAENHKPLNIRQVLWAAKLYPLIIKLQGGQNEHFSFALHFWCQLYASYEAFSEVRETRLDKSEIDQIFLESRADHTKNPSWPMMNDGYYYEVFSPWLLKR